VNVASRLLQSDLPRAKAQSQDAHQHRWPIIWAVVVALLIIWGMNARLARYITPQRGLGYGLEYAVMPSEIEQIPDLCGFLKVASSPVWVRIQIERKD
jgi:hypothetical protein